MKVVMAICIIVLVGLFFLDEIHKAPSLLSHNRGGNIHLIREKNSIHLLDEAINIGSWMRYPLKDSSVLNLIVADSTAIITKYPDSTMKIVLRPTLREKTYLFKNDKQLK